LAHAFLSGENPEIMAGNFIGDFVKGKNYLAYSKKIQAGILLHREIDFFSDTHPEFLKSKHRLLAQFGHYAGVIVDMFYDHLLAKNFSRFHTLDLKSFTEQVYRTVEDKISPLPGKSIYVFPFMKNDNWLYHYQFLDGLEQALTGMSRRTKFKVQMQKSISTLVRYEDSFFKEFSLFIHDAQPFVDNRIVPIIKGLK